MTVVVSGSGKCDKQSKTRFHNVSASGHLMYLVSGSVSSDATCPWTRRNLHKPNLADTFGRSVLVAADINNGMHSIDLE